jgi:hypothetical protein
MARDPYGVALESAEEELRQLLRQREEISSRILRLQQTVSALETLQEKENDAAPIEAPGRTGNIPITSLTDTMRHIFEHSHGEVLAPTQVRDYLVGLGIDFSRYKQPMVPVHNTLTRLEKQGEIGWVKSGDDQKSGYRWIDPFVRALVKAGEHQAVPKISYPTQTHPVVVPETRKPNPEGARNQAGKTIFPKRNPKT